MAKAKARTVFVCQQCGHESSKWLGRCPDCGEWNSLVESVDEAPAAVAGLPSTGKSRPTRLPDVTADNFSRIDVPIGEFNRVLGGGVVPGSLVLLGGDPGIGKCVTADTRILDPISGAYLPITAWASSQREVLAVDEQTLRLAPASVSAFHERGIRQIVEVKTVLGRTLRCTPDHPVLTPDGWRPVGELTAGSRIAAPRALAYFGDEALPDAAVKLIAYILSDGSAQSSISVATILPEVAQDLAQIAASFDMRLVCYDKSKTEAKQYRFVNDPAQRMPARQEVAAALHAARARLGISWQSWARRAGVSYAILSTWRRGECVPSSRELRQLADAANLSLADLAPQARDRAEAKTPIARYLERIGLRFTKAANKAVPEAIFRLPREQLGLFLKVLFTCDGSVYVNRRGVPGVSYSTISLRLAEDVQHLLLRFGLVAKLRMKHSRVNGRPYTAYEVVILGAPDVQQFLATIGILGREAACKQIAAMQLPQLSSTHRDTIPTGIPFWERLKTVGGNTGFRELSRQAGVTIRNRRHDRPLCRSTIRHLADALHDPRLDALANGDVYWDEIASVLPAGEAPVYDLTVPGNASFVANDLIIHNSTLLLQVAASMARSVGPVLYVSGEESIQQIKLRADRLGIQAPSLYLVAETNLETIVQHIGALMPGLVVVDSIQTVFRSDLSSAAGSVSQVRECAAQLQRVAKSTNIPIFLVGHVTKEGAIAGPRVLEHIVDTVLYLEGERFHTYRLLRGVKNRFGSVNEVGVFEMAAAGLIEVANPSQAFLTGRLASAAGTTVTVTLEGTRPLLVEIQALTSPTTFGLPRRTANGLDLNRVLLLTAVLTKRVGLGLGNQDIFVNVVGGLKIAEPAADLAVAVAIAASFREKSVDPHLVVAGEIGLSGEVRTIGQIDRRLSEAAKLGFRRCLLPKFGKAGHVGPPGLDVITVTSLDEALEAAFDQTDEAGQVD